MHTVAVLLMPLSSSNRPSLILILNGSIKLHAWPLYKICVAIEVFDSNSSGFLGTNIDANFKDETLTGSSVSAKIVGAIFKQFIAASTLFMVSLPA